jgi:hypothetical protein
MMVRLALLTLVLPNLAMAQVPGVLLRQDEARNYTCIRTNLDVAADTHPGAFRPDSPRADYDVRTPMVCSERLLGLGLRGARDEAVLTTLDERSSDVAVAAWREKPELHDRTWLVEVFYPDASVSKKVEFATKTALMSHGASVSDRSVSLSATDVEVLTRMPAMDTYPAACRRYADTGALSAGTVLLSVVTVDANDTALHAGLCDGGRWTWLR